MEKETEQQPADYPQETEPSVKDGIEWKRLELDKQRLDLETSREKATRLQIVLPLVIAFIVMISSMIIEIQRVRVTLRSQEVVLDAQIKLEKLRREYDQESVNINREARTELFKNLVEHPENAATLKGTYAQLFKEDANRLWGHSETPNTSRESK